MSKITSPSTKLYQQIFKQVITLNWSLNMPYIWSYFPSCLLDLSASFKHPYQYLFSLNFACRYAFPPPTVPACSVMLYLLTVICSSVGVFKDKMKRQRTRQQVTWTLFGRRNISLLNAVLHFSLVSGKYTQVFERCSSKCKSQDVQNRTGPQLWLKNYFKSNEKNSRNLKYIRQNITCIAICAANKIYTRPVLLFGAVSSQPLWPFKQITVYSRSCFLTKFYRSRPESAEASTQPQEKHLHAAPGGRLSLLQTHGPWRREHHAELSGNL